MFETTTQIYSISGHQASWDQGAKGHPAEQLGISPVKGRGIPKGPGVKVVAVRVDGANFVVKIPTKTMEMPWKKQEKT